MSFGRGAPVLRAPVVRRSGPARSLAIVGPSGSGKSTIADLLLRLLDPDSGAIRIDGRDLRAVRLEELRRRVALVDQEPCIFHATIAENIRYARPSRDRRRAADVRPRRPRSRSSSTVCRRVSTRLSASAGMALSAGERQRIAHRARVPRGTRGSGPRRADRRTRSASQSGGSWTGTRR